jgi:uncharacterized membrane protein YbhN (UPF0104 family)
MRRLAHSRTARFALMGVVIGVLVLLAIWRGPDVSVIGHAFTRVRWEWVAAAVGINFVSVVVRSMAWNVVLHEALAPPYPRLRSVFAAFSVGLLGNAALPGRVGEIARIAVLSRRTARRSGAWATIAGSVFAHRIFDVVASVSLVVAVLYTARIPDWAGRAFAILIGIGVGLLLAAFLLARRRHHPLSDELGPVRRLIAMARRGLAVLHHPDRAALALVLQLLGWAAQLFAVYTAFKAFRIGAPIPAAALVLVLMNLATVFPLWPGNIGLLQAAVALPLLRYGVGYGHGFAFGIGLQAIEASVGVGLGLVFLTREGFSFAMLRHIPEVTEIDVDEDERVERIA